MFKITKAIVPVAGWGTRRLPITKVIEKSMLPVGNRPLVDYSVRDLIKAGITDLYLVVGNSEPCQVRAYYQDNIALNRYLAEREKASCLKLAKTLPDQVKIHYIVQDPSQKYGTAVPIAMAVEQYQINEPVLVFMGDDFVWSPNGESAAEALLAARWSDDDSVILGVQVDPDTVDQYGVLSSDGEKLTSIVEKPKINDAPSNLINVSKYLMAPALLQEIVRYVNHNIFGPTEQEFLVTDPIMSYIAFGGIMRIARSSGEYLDGGTLEGWVHANNVILCDTVSPDIAPPA